MKHQKTKTSEQQNQKQAPGPTKSPSEIKFLGILKELKGDGDGCLTVKFEVSKNELDQVMALYLHTEKVLAITIIPPNKEITFGKIQQ